MATPTVLRTQPRAWAAAWIFAGLVCVGVAFIQPFAAVALFVVILGVLIVSQGAHDSVTVLGFVVLLAFAIPSPFVFEPLGGSASPAAMLALFAFWLWCMGRLSPGLGLATGRQPIRLMMWIYAATIVISCAAAFARVLPLTELNAPWRALVAVAAALGLALLAADGIPNRRRLEQLLRWLVYGGAFAAFVAILQFLFDIDLASSLKPPGLGVVNEALFVQERAGLRRAAGVAAHPIELSVILVALLPIALYFALRDHRDGERRRLATWAPFLLIAFAIPTTLSRTAVIGLVAMGVWLLPTWSWKRRLTALALTGAFILFIQIVNAKVISTIVDLFTNASQDVSITTRQSDYTSAFDLIGRAPLFGRGYKTFLPQNYFYVDNQYLIHTIETGLIGLLALVALLVVGIGTAEGARRHATDADTKELARAIGASLLVITVTFATFDALSFPLVTTLTFLMLGIAGALWRLVRQPAPAAVVAA